jgi:hypothetical protein
MSNENDHRYYIPRTDEGFREWALNFLTVAELNAALWKFTVSMLTELRTKTDEYIASLTKATAPSASSVDIAEKNEVKKALIHEFTDFVNREVRYNDAIDDAGLVALGAPRRDKIRTTQAPPHQRPVIEIEPSKTREHLIRWHVDEDESRALPYGVNGWVLVYHVAEPGEELPTDPDEMGHSTLVTRNPIVIPHKPGDEGKKCAYAGAFQNKKGEKGPWSDVVVAVIP